jgi:hypothetical protein
LTQLLKKGLEKGPDDEQEKKKKMVKDLVKKVAQEGMKESCLDHTKYKYTVACSLRQSRFCTYSKERTAPLLEMTTNQHKEIEEQVGICVHAIVPLSKDGMFVRCFYNREDKDGTLIKIMPQSILLFPSTVIMEYGRLTNVDGHRHLLLKILYTQKGKVPFDMTLARREYPHLKETKDTLAAAGDVGDDWEKDFRFVNYRKVDQKTEKDPTALKFLESTESNKLEELYTK